MHVHYITRPVELLILVITSYLIFSFHFIYFPHIPYTGIYPMDIGIVKTLICKKQGKCGCYSDATPAYNGLVWNISENSTVRLGALATK